jgi:hypothetical protein
LTDNIQTAKEWRTGNWSVFFAGRWKCLGLINRTALSNHYVFSLLYKILFVRKYWKMLGRVGPEHEELRMQSHLNPGVGKAYLNRLGTEVRQKIQPYKAKATLEAARTLNDLIL